MNDGLSLSAGGALANMVRMDVIANNLANVNTTGFKPEHVDFQSTSTMKTRPGGIDADRLLDQLGAGISVSTSRTEHRQGTLTQSANPLDVAIEGNGFFVVSNSKAPGDNLRLTRDGRFTLNTNGELVMVATGSRVLNTNNKPIRLDTSAPIHIDANGMMRQNGREITQLNIASAAHSNLAREGHNLFRVKVPASLTNATGFVRQGFIEASVADPITSLHDMIQTSKAVQANVTLMQYHDHILGQAINTFARVA